MGVVMSTVPAEVEPLVPASSEGLLPPMPAATAVALLLELELGWSVVLQP